MNNSFPIISHALVRARVHTGRRKTGGVKSRNNSMKHLVISIQPRSHFANTAAILHSSSLLQDSLGSALEAKQSRTIHWKGRGGHGISRVFTCQSPSMQHIRVCDQELGSIANGRSCMLRGVSIVDLKVLI